MNLYKVTIYDWFFEMELGGEFEAASEVEAEEMAREHYAQELGTTPGEIDVVDVKETDAPTTAHPQAKTPHHDEGQEQSMTQPEHKVNLGSIYTTPAVSDEMARNSWFRYDLHAAVGRFADGDWGECFETDAEFNESALDAGADKIIGVYDTQLGRVWVMAEPWKAATTILFEHEF